MRGSLPAAGWWGGDGCWRWRARHRPPPRDRRDPRGRRPVARGLIPLPGAADWPPPPGPAPDGAPPDPGPPGGRAAGAGELQLVRPRRATRTTPCSRGRNGAGTLAERGAAAHRLGGSARRDRGADPGAGPDGGGSRALAEARRPAHHAGDRGRLEDGEEAEDREGRDGREQEDERRGDQCAEVPGGHRRGQRLRPQDQDEGHDELADAEHEEGLGAALQGVVGARPQRGQGDEGKEGGDDVDGGVAGQELEVAEQGGGDEDQGGENGQEVGAEVCGREVQRPRREAVHAADHLPTGGEVGEGEEL